MLYSVLFLCTLTAETLTYYLALQHENKKHRLPLKEETPLSFLSLRSSLEKMQAMNRIDTLMLCLHFFNAIFNLKVT